MSSREHVILSAAKDLLFGETMATEIGSTVKGTVVKILDYGAIIRLDDGGSGLVHISEIAESYVRDVKDYLSERDEVNVKVLAFNKKGRYELSIKQRNQSLPAKVETRELAHAVAQSRPPERRQAFQSPPLRREPASFEERLSRFLKDSDERMHEMRRHIDAKRGRR